MRRFEGRELLVATHNIGKLEEIADLLRGREITIRSMAEFGLEVPEETEETFAGNALLKAHAAAKATGLVCLADDSGLMVDALDGQPGVRTADWAETPDGRDFGLAMARVHAELGRCGKPAPWTAKFVCALVLAWPDGHEEVCEGYASGQIVRPGRGVSGHGYDPIFLPDGYSVTFGEMDRWEKNRISHRGRAFALLASRFT
jgi:XTP/dITP diphosphohydrolase